MATEIEELNDDQRKLLLGIEQCKRNGPFPHQTKMPPDTGFWAGQCFVRSGVGKRLSQELLKKSPQQG